LKRQDRNVRIDKSMSKMRVSLKEKNE